MHRYSVLDGGGEHLSDVLINGVAVVFGGENKNTKFLTAVIETRNIPPTI